MNAVKNMLCGLIVLNLIMFYYYLSFITFPFSIKKPILTGGDQNFELNPTTGVYEIDGKPILWQFWHNDDVPLFVRLLVEAMQCRNPEFRSILVHDSTIRHYLPDLNVSEEIWQKLITQHRADLFRVHIMYKYGGAYADVDTFTLDKFYPWYQQLKDFDFVTANYGNEITAIGAIGPVRAGSRLFKIWTQNQIRIINEKFPNLSWGNIGPGAMGGFKEEIESNKTRYRGYDGVATADRLVHIGLAHGSNLLFENIKGRFIPLPPTPYLFVYGAGLRKYYGNVTDVQDMLPKNTTLYSAFVGCALLDCWWKYEAMIEKGQTGSVDPKEIMRFLKRIDYGVCQELQKRK